MSNNTPKTFEFRKEVFIDGIKYVPEVVDRITVPVSEPVKQAIESALNDTVEDKCGDLITYTNGFQAGVYWNQKYGDILPPKDFMGAVKKLNLNTNDTPIPSKLMERENTESPNQKGIDFCSTIHKAKPTNDNAFWTDELVKEFVIAYNKIDKLISGVDPIGQTIKEWKQSKQSAPEPSVLHTKEQYVPRPKDYVTMDGIIANVETVFHYKRTVGVVYVSGQKIVRDEWSFDRIEPLKNAPTEPVVEDKQKELKAIFNLKVTADRQRLFINNIEVFPTKN